MIDNLGNLMMLSWCATLLFNLWVSYIFLFIGIRRRYFYAYEKLTTYGGPYMSYILQIYGDPIYSIYSLDHPLVPVGGH